MTAQEKARRPISLEYNSVREELLMPEYGRHVQKLVEDAKQIEDKTTRQKAVEAIIELMNQMNPSSRNIADYKLRLWKHVFQIANYDLDVEAPKEVSTARPEVKTEKVKVHYPQNEFKYRHYGHTLQLMIEKAIKTEKEDEKLEFTKVIAAYMKLALRTWSQEQQANDQIVKSDLKMLSKGKLSLSEDYKIMNLVDNSGSHRAANNQSRSNNSKRKKKSSKRKRTTKR